MSARESFKLSAIAVLVANVFAITATHAATAGEDTLTTDKVNVISTTPLPSLGVPVTAIAAPVQVIKGSDIKRSQALDLSEYLNRHAGSVYVNEIQNNPLQPDLNYRGFTASPLLGTPQGLSLYVDGVRMNQPFGDVVSWDLIPRNVIGGMQLMPGSNPLFGLNTLGGALSIQTKNGRDNAGGAIQTTFGSYGRKIGEFEYGGSQDQLDWFVAGTYFDENGWRDHSESDAKNIFGKLGWRGDRTDLKLTYSHANTDLNGNGLSPQSFLRRDYKSVFTWPDNTRNQSNFVNLQWDHYFTDDVAFSGNAYYRRIKTSTLNGDLNETAMPEEVGGVGQNIYTAAFARRPYSAANNAVACRAQFVAGGEPGEKCTGVINRSSTHQEHAGLFSQLSVNHALFGNKNNVVVGGGVDVSRVRFSQSAEFGSITADRGVLGYGVFANPANGFNLDDELDDRSANLKGRTTTWSVYGSDTLALADNLHLTASARYNHVRVRNRDQDTHYVYDGSGGFTNEIDEDASLSGSHSFNRINPALGVSYSPLEKLNTYIGYNEGSRAPTTIELGCANPDAPCRLPNSMAGDPPLKQVVTKTWEAGFRGLMASNLHWNAGVFSSRNIDDIMFLATNTSEGYFDNFGQTRRRGIEAGFSGDWGDWSLGANYTYLDATYQSSEGVNGEANSSNNAGRINIAKGDRIPLVPRNILKAFASYRLSPRFNIGGDVIAISNAYARGNENNEHQADGMFYGDGKVSGYAVVNLSAAFQINSQWNVFAKVNNVFDREYATAGQLGASPFSMGTGDYVVGGANGRRSTSVGETFLAPGAPRTGWVGVRWEFAQPKQLASK